MAGSESTAPAESGDEPVPQRRRDTALITGPGIVAYR